MAEAAGKPIDFSEVARRFSEHAELAARLAAGSEEFRGLCEDHALAVATLRRLEQGAQFADQPRLAEYRHVVLELEREIASAIARARVDDILDRK